MQRDPSKYSIRSLGGSQLCVWLSCRSLCMSVILVASMESGNLCIWNITLHDSGTSQKVSHIRPRKKETLFYGWTDLPSRAGWLGHFFFEYFLFAFWWQKLLSVKKKNNNNNTHKNLQKIWHILEKNFGKVFSVIFKNFQQNFLWLGQKRLILHDFSKKKKKGPQNGKSGVVRPVKQGFLFSWLKA